MDMAYYIAMYSQVVSGMKISTVDLRYDVFSTVVTVLLGCMLYNTSTSGWYTDLEITNTGSSLRCAVFDIRWYSETEFHCRVKSGD